MKEVVFKKCATKAPEWLGFSILSSTPCSQNTLNECPHPSQNTQHSTLSLVGTMASNLPSQQKGSGFDSCMGDLFGARLGSPRHFCVEFACSPCAHMGFLCKEPQYKNTQSRLLCPGHGSRTEQDAYCLQLPTALEGQQNGVKAEVKFSGGYPNMRVCVTPLPARRCVPQFWRLVKRSLSPSPLLLSLIWTGTHTHYCDGTRVFLS